MRFASRAPGLLLFIQLILVISTVADAAVRFQRPKPILEPIQTTPGADPLLSTAWYLDYIGAYDAWKTTQGSRDTLIAIVDSGVNYNHSELFAAVKRNLNDCNFNQIDDDNNGFVDDCVGWNFADKTSLPWDDDGHGTFIASIIASQPNNNEGSIGICPNCSLLAARFLDKDGMGDTIDAVRSIDYAILSGASVINLSFAGEGDDKDLRNILKKARDNDIVVVAAAGNDGKSNDKHDIYPANYNMPNMLTVAAARRDEDLWVDSNYGVKRVDVAAPGTTIWGLWIDDKWYRSQGTSFAAPIVAGIAGLIRSANPKLTAPEVVEIIKNTVTISRHLEKKINTSGIVNAAAAVQCAVDLSCLEDKKSKARGRSRRVASK